MARPRRRAITGPRAVWALNALLAAATVCLWPAVAALPAPETGLEAPFWALVAAFALTERLVVHIHFRRSAHSLTLGEMPLVVGLLACEPDTVVAAWVVGAGLVLATDRGLARIRLIFNLLLFAITAMVAAFVLHALISDQVGLGPAAWGAALVAAVASAAAAAALITTAMTLAEGAPALRRAGRMFATAVVVAAVNAGTALGVATTLDADPRAAIFLLGPVGAVLLAGRAYTAERRKHQGLEFLYETADALAGAPDRSSALAAVLVRAVKAFRAETAEIFLLPRAGEPAMRTAIAPGDAIELLRPADPDVAAAFQEALAGRRSAIVTPANAPAALGAHLRASGVREAMVAPLGDEHAPAGAIVVADRLGIERGFGTEDLLLLEMLAHHTGAHVANGRLEGAIAELRDAQESLRRQAFHDPLTELPNRLLFVDRVEHALARRDGNVVLMYIDLDRFKEVNDTLGHDAGDKLLVATAERLRDSLRTADTPARLGGDEFAVLLTDVAERDARTVARRILDNLRRPVDIGPATVSVHASLGVAIASSGSIDAAGLMRDADAAMYASKHEGGSDFRLHSAASTPTRFAVCQPREALPISQAAR